MMNKKAIIGAGLSLLVILGAVTVSSGSVFAEGTDNSLAGKFMGMKAGIMGKKAPDKEMQQEKLKTELAELVKAGTLTQAEADKVAEYIENNLPEKNMAEGVRVSPFEQMVTDGVLTQEKADAIAEALPCKPQGRRGEFSKPKANLSDNLSGLVSDGTLTQAEADKVIEYMENNRPEKTMAEGVRVSPFEQMVTDGVLTQEKADAIAKAIHNRAHRQMNKAPAVNQETSES